MIRLYVQLWDIYVWIPVFDRRVECFYKIVFDTSDEKFSPTLRYPDNVVLRLVGDMCLSLYMHQLIVLYPPPTLGRSADDLPPWAKALEGIRMGRINWASSSNCYNLSMCRRVKGCELRIVALWDDLWRFQINNNCSNWQITLRWSDLCFTQCDSHILIDRACI